MIFLIEYDRHGGRIIAQRVFDSLRRLEAENVRVERELALHREGVRHEIVLLDASDEHALRETHSRYFEDSDELARGLRDKATEL